MSLFKALSRMNNGAEKEYYGKVEYYLLQLENEQRLAGHTQQDISEKYARQYQVNNELAAIEERMRFLREAITTIKERRIHQPLSTESLESEALGYVESRDEGSITQQEQTILESELVELENQKSVKETEVESLKTEIKQLERNNHYTQGHQTYLQLVSELGNEYSQVEQAISELKGNMQVNEKRDANHTVHATGEGIVHYHTPLKIGTTLQQGQVIAEISKHDESTYYVETFVPTTEISKVKVGQKADLAIVGVNVQKYGTLKGTIQTIDTGVVTQRVEQSSQQFYRIHVALDSKTLAHGNQEIKLVLSMPVEVRIVYDEETYFDWLLEQLRFKN